MGQFAFIVHPMEATDVSKRYPFLRFLPSRWLEGMMRLAPPFITSQVTGVRSEFGEAEGHFIVCPLTSRQILALPEDYVVSRIIATGRVAERLGARIVGLGALTAVVGEAGHRVAESLDIAVTTGNSYTVATAIEGTRRAIDFMEYDMNEIGLAVLGATGSIGQICSEIMAREVRHLTLVARDSVRLDALRDRILESTGVSARISTDLRSVLPACDAVIAASSSADALVHPGDLKPGAVVCDVARPRDVSRQVAEARDDVLVIEGGVVAAPGDADFGFDFGVPPGSCMACMAETVVLAMEGRYENYTLGRNLTVRQVEEIDRLARKHGFVLSGFRAFEREIPEEDLERTKKRALERRAEQSISQGRASSRV
ncbi:MAG: shikimate dehydrogenase [Bacillota bacterium]